MELQGHKKTGMYFKNYAQRQREGGKEGEIMRIEVFFSIKCQRVLVDFVTGRRGE